MQTMNIYTYCLRDGYIYSKFKKLVRKFMKIYKMPTVRHWSFLMRIFSTIGIPKSTVLLIIFRVFIWLLSIRNSGKKALSIFRVSKWYSKKGQDHLIMKQRTMELLRRLLILKRHPNLRKFLGKISMPNSTYL